MRYHFRGVTLRQEFPCKLSRQLGCRQRWAAPSKMNATIHVYGIDGIPYYIHNAVGLDNGEEGHIPLWKAKHGLFEPVSHPV